MISYILEADFTTGYTITLKYDFVENKFANKLDGREKTDDVEIAMYVFKEKPESENVKEYRLIKEIFNEETGDSEFILLAKQDGEYYH